MGCLLGALRPRHGDTLRHVHACWAGGAARLNGTRHQLHTAGRPAARRAAMQRGTMSSTGGVADWGMGRVHGWRGIALRRLHDSGRGGC